VLRLPLAILLIGALPLVACTPALTAEDARPFQACAVDTDCTTDSLSCDGCGGVAAIASTQQPRSASKAACWETPVDPFTSRCKGIGVGGQPVCLAGRCSLLPGRPPTGPR
jgi:hypothetical protein